MLNIEQRTLLNVERRTVGVMVLQSATLVFCALMASVSFAVEVASPANEVSQADGEFFREKIEPVFREHCYECHSADADEISGGLRLDTRDGIREGGDNGPAIDAGDVNESFLLKVIRYEEDDYQMPPDGKLPDRIIADFEKWVKIGAPDPRKSSTAPPTPEPEGIDLEEARRFWAFQPPQKTPPPSVANAAWPRGDVDRFLLAALEREGLAPAPAADRRTLIRRATFALTGLPPTPAEIAAFLADDAPQAWERVVDRLLESPRFGERWGRHWLDVARYADSNGLDINVTYHNAWRYRDYVISAFNNDKPFDRFVREQIAGDLLPYEDDDQRAEQVIATGFLVIGPKMLSERDKEKLRMDVVDEQIDTVGKAFLGMTLGCARCHDHKFDPIPTSDYYALAGIFRSTTTVNGIKLGNVFVSGWMLRPLPMEPEHAEALAAHEARVKKLEGEIKRIKDVLKVESTIRAAKSLPGIVVDDAAAKIVGSWKNSTYSPVYVDKGYIHDDKVGKGEKSITFTPDLPASGEYEVRISFAGGSGRSDKVPVVIRHAEGETRVMVDQTKQPDIDGLFKSLGRFSFAAGNESSLTISTEGTAGGYVIADAAQFIPVKSLDNKDAQAQLAAKDDPAAAEAKKLKKQLTQFEKQLKEIQAAAPQPAPRAMAVQDVTEPGDYRIAIRGNVRRLGDVAPRGFVSVAAEDPVPEIAPDQSGRLELARWIADDNNPLTARVRVNRVWSHLFQEGLARSVDNFGHLGERPSHPELLENLAVDFAESGWSTKRLIRRIMLSRAYRMSTAVSERAAEVDPENRLLWRFPRKRLEAEAVRDAMLSISGRLDLSKGGSAVESLGETAIGNTSKSPIDTESLTRRSIYLPILRSDTPPILAAFDFADPEMVVGRRAATTVPAQALYLMNSPFAIEQSRLAAERLLQSERLSDAERVSTFYEMALARRATDQQQQAALEFIHEAKAAAEGENAELAAWASFCQAVFASTEFRFLE